MTDYMVTGLVKKRAELASDVERTHERLRQLVNDLESIDREAIKIEHGSTLDKGGEAEEKG